MFFSWLASSSASLLYRIMAHVAIGGVSSLTRRVVSELSAVGAENTCYPSRRDAIALSIASICVLLSNLQ
jgi:hypothetical protein